MKVIQLNNVCEKYRIKFVRDRHIQWEEIWALRDVDFAAQKGEVIGVIGKNSAGKTTLLKLIGGMLIPDKGEVNIEGKVSALMELGAGFNPEFTGRENIGLNATVYGLTEAELTQRIDDIIDFAGLGKFIDAPIKYYSQGMYMRLAFALAIFVEPDILLIDDILAVGDREAQEKCIKKVFELKEAGKTIVVVSHDMNMINNLCDRVIHLEEGKIVFQGVPARAIAHYTEAVKDEEGVAVLEKGQLKAAFDNGRLNISYAGVALTKGEGGYLAYFKPQINDWFSSCNLSWQVDVSSSSKIVAKGRRYDGSVSQVWAIELGDDDLKWQIDLREKDVREPHIDMLFNPHYTKWVTIDRDEGFSAFINKTKWQNLSLSCRGDLVGIISEQQSEVFPGLIFQGKDIGDKVRFLNTGSESEARVVQCSVDPGAENSISIKVFTRHDGFKSCIEKERSRYCALEKVEENLENTAVLDKGLLRVVFDQGKLKVSYKNLPLTKEKGGYVAYFNPKTNTWMSSASLSWQLTDCSDDKIVAEGRKEDGSVSQVWVIGLGDDDLKWQINMHDSEITDPHVDLFITPHYKRWVTVDENGEFPDFTDKPQWYNIGLNYRSNLVGISPAPEFEGFPYLVLAEEELREKLLFLNTGYTEEARIVQWKLEPDGESSVSFRVFVQNDEFEAYMKKNKPESQPQEDKTSEFNFYTISAGDVRVYVNIALRIIQIFYKDKEITAAKGLYSSFYAFRQWFHPPHSQLLFHADWKVKSITAEKIVLALWYEPLFLFQHWTLECKDDNTIEVKVEVKNHKPVRFTKQYLMVDFKEAYTGWRSVYEKGDFSLARYNNDIAPVRLKENKISKIELLPRTGEGFPPVFLEVDSQLDRRIVSIYKKKQSGEEVVGFNSSLIIPGKAEMLPPGRYSYFEGKIVVGKESKLDTDVLPTGLAYLEKDDLKFTFNRGKGEISWKGKKLTSGLSVYTSLRSLGIWYDSYQAVWQDCRVEDNKITVFGYWPHIPVMQTWQLELMENNTILWQVDMEVFQEVDLEINQANIMLDSCYKTWKIAGETEGRFSEEYAEDYDILPFRLWYGKGDRITVEGEGFPQLRFKASGEDRETRLIVENTDNFYQARLLQYQKTSSRRLFPAKYPCFKGTIEIGNER